MTMTPSSYSRSREPTPDERQIAKSLFGLDRKVGGMHVNLFQFAYDSRSYHIWIVKAGSTPAKNTVLSKHVFDSFDDAWAYYINDAVVLL